MPNVTFGTILELWNDGNAALFGSNTLLTGGFYFVMCVFIANQLGLSIGVAVPAGLAVVFLMTVLSPSLLPSSVWTVVLLIVGLVIARFVAREFIGRG
jgi:hypothetical protein